MFGSPRGVGTEKGFWRFYYLPATLETPRDDLGVHLALGLGTKEMLREKDGREER